MKFRELREKIRVAFAWEVDVWNSSDAYLTEHNSITGQWRHRKTMASSGSLWISPWVDGKPPRVAATPPTGGSGVKPAPDKPLHIGIDLGGDAGDAMAYAIRGCKNLEQASAERRDDLLKRIRELMPQGLMLEAGEPVFTPPRVFALEPMARGGFVVSAGGRKTFAGSLTDCLNFIEFELTEEAS